MASLPILNNLRTPIVRGGPSRGVAILATGAAALGAGLAIRSGAELYRSREGMAGQFQQELTFPSDLIQPSAGGESRNFFMGFTFMKYEKRSIQNSPFLRSEGTVRLPIPDGIRDNLSVTYGSPSLGPTVGAALDSIAGTPIAGGSIAETTSNVFGAVGNAALGGLEGAAANTLNTGQAGQAAQAYLGLAVNPYQTVLFEKPEFKSHSFSWKIMPKSEQESDIVRNIFRTFQYHASPGVSQGAGVFFSYPSTVMISLYPSSEFLYRFKPCVIKSVNVNYAAGSNPSFFKRTNAPTSMTLSIQLQEIEYWTNKDFTADSFSDREAETRQFLQQSSRRAAAQPLGPTGE